MGVLSHINWREYFPALSSRSFLSHYLPASGAISHTLFAIHIFNPSIVSRLFPVGDLAVSNTILFTANIGLGFYVYFRRHLHRLNSWDRVEFSVFSSTLFNFGSLLAAVLTKALLPQRTSSWTRSLLAASLSIYLLSRAHKYLHYVDARVIKISPSPRSLRSPVMALEKNGNFNSHHRVTNGTDISLQNADGAVRGDL